MSPLRPDQRRVPSSGGSLRHVRRRCDHDVVDSRRTHGVVTISQRFCVSSHTSTDESSTCSVVAPPTTNPRAS